jgi:hypothetical protein
MVKMSFTPIVPKGKVFDDKAVLKAIENTLKDVTGRKLQTDFKKTVRTWDNKPSFKKVFIRQPNQMIEKVFPTGSAKTPSGATVKDIYYYVHEGTKPRVIVPGGGKGPMYFQPGYIASSRKGAISSRSASRFGPLLRANTVGTMKKHSIKARKFSTAIAKKNQRPFEVDIQEAINRAVD